jgi:hypothetical protein
VVVPVTSDHEILEWIKAARWDWPVPSQTCGCGSSYWAKGFARACKACRAACSHVDRVPGRKVYASGGYHPMALCLTCGELVSLPAGSGKGDWVFKDNRIRREVHPCARCGSEDGTEEHHWAPRAIFGFAEADRWPTSWLCPPCHRTWHNEMRKAGGYRLPPEERIDDSFGFGALEQAF